jgi:hypothetical protein
MKSFRHRQQPPLPHDQTAAVVLISFYQVGFETEPFSQRQCFRLFRDEGIGSAFEKKTVALTSLNNPANPTASFEQSQINLLSRLAVALEYSVGCCQAGDAAANDYDAFHLNSIFPHGASVTLCQTNEQQPGAQTSLRGPSVPRDRRGVSGSMRSIISSRIISINAGCVPAVAARIIFKPSS